MTDGGRSALASLLDRGALPAVLDVLDRHGDETRIVGGAVRNALLGRPVTEIDLATTALPAVTVERAEAAGFKAVKTGFEHGTVTVVARGEPFEVTTLRADVETDGRHARVLFSRDFAADAARRDFTVNALSLSRDGTLHDAVGGLADVRTRRIRFVGDPRTRIREDYLRILRFFRFSAEYAAGPLDPDGLDAAIRERDGLAILSRERVRAEILKLLAAPRAADITTAMTEAGLLPRLLGGVIDAGRLARAAGRPPIARLAAAAILSPADPDRLRERLRLSNAEHARLADYAAAAARLGGAARVDAGALRRLAFRAGPEAVADAATALAGEPRPVLTAEAEALLQGYRDGTEPRPVFPLAGRDLMAAGVPAGPELGRRLAAERERWLDAGCPDGWALTAT